jgi:hypothetical protein
VSGQWEAETPARVGQGGQQDAGDVQNLPRPVDPVASAPEDLEKLEPGLAEDTARQAGDVDEDEAGPGPTGSKE